MQLAPAEVHGQRREYRLSATTTPQPSPISDIIVCSSQYAKLAISLKVPGGGKKKKAAAAPQGGASGAPAAANEEEDEYEGGLC